MISTSTSVREPSLRATILPAAIKRDRERLLIERNCAVASGGRASGCNWITALDCEEPWAPQCKAYSRLGRRCGEHWLLL